MSGRVDLIGQLLDLIDEDYDDEILNAATSKYRDERRKAKAFDWMARADQTVLDSLMLDVRTYSATPEVWLQAIESEMERES